jgi:hypothetical protein
MYKFTVFLTILFVGVSSWGGFSSLSFAQGSYSITLSSDVTADPGQTDVPIYLVLTSASSIGGMDMFLEFDKDVLTCSSIRLLTRFQYVSYDITPAGKIRLIVRRHHPDSTYIAPLAPGMDTLGLIRLNVTSQDLLVDVETNLRFFENPLTPFADNRLVKTDSSFIVSPELSLIEGSVFIKHPLYGDVNDDGYPKTIADVIFFINFIAGSQNLTTRQRANSDLNRDGVQGNMADFIEIVRVVWEE